MPPPPSRAPSSPARSRPRQYSPRRGLPKSQLAPTVRHPFLSALSDELVDALIRHERKNAAYRSDAQRDEWLWLTEQFFDAVGSLPVVGDDEHQAVFGEAFDLFAQDEAVFTSPSDPEREIQLVPNYEHRHGPIARFKLAMGTALRLREEAEERAVREASRPRMEDFLTR